MTNLERALRDFAAGVALQQAGRFRQALLFGSHGRGDARPDSDVDVAVILSDMPDGLIDTTVAMADVAYDILLETGIDIQPVPLTEDQWRHPTRHSNPLLVENIRREGKAL